VEGLTHDARNVVGVLDQVGMLHHRVGDAGGVGLLEGVLAQQGREGLPCNDDDGGGVHERREQPGDRVGRAGPGGHEDDAGLAGGAGVAVRHVCGALFVAHQDQLDLRVHEGIEHRHGCPTRQAEDVLHPLALEALDQFFSTSGQFLFHDRSPNYV
jgi:hypothetical protein